MTVNRQIVGPRREGTRIWRGVRFGLCAGVLATAALLWGAGPAAAAATGSVFIDGLLTRSWIGTAVEFDTVVTNDSVDTPLARLAVLFHVELAGLTPEQVLIERRADDGAWVPLADKVTVDGLVEARDTTDQGISVAPGATVSGWYRLTILAGAPVGDASIVAVLGTLDDGWFTRVSTSKAYTMTLVSRDPLGGVVVASPTPSPSRTTGSPAVSVAARIASADRSSNLGAGEARGEGPPPDPRDPRAAPPGPRQINPVHFLVDLMAWLVALGLVWLAWKIWRRFSTEAVPPAGRGRG